MIRCIVALVGERVKQLIWTEKILRVLISSHTSIGSGLLVIWISTWHPIVYGHYGKCERTHTNVTDWQSTYTELCYVRISKIQQKF
jgi:hypothetical protein